MSSQPPATPSTGTSKSAAKKRAKKIAKALAAAKESASATSAAGAATAGTTSTSDPDVAARLAALDAAYSLPPGGYPDGDYDSSFYDNVELPPAAAAAAAAAVGATAGANPEFGFASYAFDRNLVSQPNGSPFSGLSQSINITHEDLLETANELWKRMGETDYGEDDPYWSSLPTHVRQFIREAIPFNGNLPNTPNDPQATQKDLYAMAQRIVHAASQGMGLQGVGTNLLQQVNGRAHLQTSIADDLGFRHHPDAVGRTVDDDFDDEEDFDDEPEPGYVQPNGDAPKKKNKKKKKKAAQVQDPPPAALPPPAVKQPPRQPMPPQPPVQPALNPPPPPVTTAPTQPPPSSRAAGKQPMPHTPQPPPSMVRSLRAAGKAPVSATSHSHHTHTHPPPSKTSSKGKAAAATPPAKVWTTASPEERESITQFWLALNEAERRDLLQIEKDAVLRRMKEQQRHSCGCAVCGRKKVNIETELDQLYEQYYLELERYTQHQRAAIASDDFPRPPGAGPFPGSVELDSSGQLLKLDHLAPNPNQHPSIDESDDYDDEDDYEDEEELDDDELASDEAEADYAPRSKSTKSVTPRPEGTDDFYGFGSGLATIKGVLTVADDMLKNDGAKFLEMMEQLAVKRVAREEINARELQEETDEDDDEDDESISEAQRLEDGKRMFAIFASRMFEQRVLQAYRERVAKEREEQLLRELDMEEDNKRAREEKKAKEAQRKKDKKRAQKQRQDEERAARDAQLAEEQRLAKLKAQEDARERAKRQEEERARREAAKRAAQEEAVRKEAERRKRQEEERAREEEAARRKREREEKIKKEREAREREAREKERREKEERERAAKERAEKERVAKEAREKAEKERLAKLEEERLEKQRRDEAARRDREAAEQKKILAAQQAARERAAAEKAAAERAAAERAKASGSAIRPPPGMGRPKVSTALSPNARTRPSPPGATPLISSPPTPGSVRPGPSVRGPPKTPQPSFFNQPPPGMAAFNSRPSAPGAFVQSGFGGRPPFPGQSPVFAAPPSNGGQPLLPNSLSASPSAMPRGYGAPPESAFDFDRGPLGYPKGPARVGSTEDPFRAPGGPAPPPIGQRVPSQPASLYSDNDSDPFVMGRLDGHSDPIGTPGPIGTRPTFDHAPGAGAPRGTSPSQPDRVLGSAALGAADDEIVTPAARRAPPPPAGAGWKMPQAPGAGRWSAAPPSIWGIDSTSSLSSPWSRSFGAPSPVSGPVSAVSASSSIAPDFGGVGLPGGVAPGGSGPTGSGAVGVPPIGEAPRPPPGFGPPGGAQYGHASQSSSHGAYASSLFGPPQPHH